MARASTRGNEKAWRRRKKNQAKRREKKSKKMKKSDVVHKSICSRRKEREKNVAFCLAAGDSPLRFVGRRCLCCSGTATIQFNKREALSELLRACGMTTKDRDKGKPMLLNPKRRRRPPPRTKNKSFHSGRAQTLPRRHHPFPPRRSPLLRLPSLRGPRAQAPDLQRRGPQPLHPRPPAKVRAAPRAAEEGAPRRLQQEDFFRWVL